MVNNKDRLKELLGEALPLIEEFLQDDMEEESDLFGEVDQELENSEDEYNEDIMLTPEEMEGRYDEDLDEEDSQDTKKARKKMSAMAITKKLGKGNKK